MSVIHFTPFPTLTTERLVLRPLAMTDDEAIFAHRNDEVVNTYLDDFRHAGIEDTGAFISRVQGEIAAGNTILWVLTRKGNDTFMGTVCLWNIVMDKGTAETGYTLDPEYHGMGYMDEALKQAISYGLYTLGLNAIDAYTHEHNKASIQLLLRNGFTQCPPKKQVPVNRVCFSLTK